MNEKVSPGATLFAVCTAGFLMPFMLSGVGIALPSIGAEFHANAVELGLVETAYMASVSIFMLAMGRLGDIYGRRRVFTIGVVLFASVGGLLSLTRSIEEVIALRFFQGIAGAMVASTGPAIVVSVFPPEKRGRALGIQVAAIYAGLSLGPSLGGALVSFLGWRSLFYLVVPLGAILFAIITWKLKGEWAEARGEPFDWRGGIVYGLSIMLLVVGAANLAKMNFAWLLLGLGTIGMLAFVILEANTAYPVLDVKLLWNNRIFAFSNLAALLNYAATFGVTFFLSLYLQYSKGMTPHHAGLVMITQPLTQAVLSPACGRLSDRMSAAWVATAGMGLCALGLFAAAFIGMDTPLPFIVGILLSLGLGFALFSSPNTSVIMGSVQPKYLGVASGLSSSMRSLGMMTSMTVITIILSMLMGGEKVTPATMDGFLASMRVSFICFALFCVAGIGCSMGRLKPASN